MTLSEGIVKINSKTLESSELKKYDKLEKEGIAHVGAIQKGKDTLIFSFFTLNLKFVHTISSISFEQKCS